MDVLWLEDDFKEVFWVVKELTNFGFHIFRATSIDIAERMLNQRQFDLIVLDSFMNKHGRDGSAGEHAGIHLGRRIQCGEFGEWGTTANILFLTSYRDAVLRQLEKEHFTGSQVFSKNESRTRFFEEVTQMSDTKAANSTHIHVNGDAHFGDVMNTGHGAVVGGHNASTTTTSTKSGISIEELRALEEALAAKREYEAAQRIRELADAPDHERPSKESAFRKWFSGTASTVKDVIQTTANGLKIWDKISSIVAE